MRGKKCRFFDREGGSDIEFNFTGGLKLAGLSYDCFY